MTTETTKPADIPTKPAWMRWLFAALMMVGASLGGFRLASQYFLTEENTPAVANDSPQSPPINSREHLENKRLSEAGQQKDEAVNNDDATTPLVINDSLSWSNHIAIIDERLRGGDYGGAIRDYRALLKQTQGVGRSNLILRIALCAEASGNYHEAIEAYRTVQQQVSQHGQSAFALYGEVRCLVEVPQSDLLSHDVLRWTLADQSRLPDEVNQELLHAVGRGLIQRLESNSKANLLDENTFAAPLLQLEPARLLDELERVALAPPPTQKPVGFEVLQRAGESPDGIYLRICCRPSDVVKLLTELTLRSGFECTITPNAQTDLSGRTQVVDVSDQSMSLLLDGLCIPFGCVWRVDGDRIEIASIDDLDATQYQKFHLSFVERLTRAALLEAPESAQAGYTRVGLATLLFHQGLPADAAHVLKSQLETDPRSNVASETAFNLAKCLLALKQPEDASVAFLKCIDSGGRNQELGIVSHLYVGRLMIEQDRYRPATSTWTRALALAHRTEYESVAALALASGYMLSGSPRGANEVLMEHRDTFVTDNEQDTAAFLSAFARFRAAILDNRKDREGRALVAALTHFHPESQFGPHWYMIAGEAYDELGISSEAQEQYRRLLASAPAQPLRSRTILSLARQLREEDRIDEAAVLLAGIVPRDELLTNSQGGLPGTSPHIGDAELLAAIDMADLSLARGDATAAIESCRKLVPLTTDAELRRRALRTLGRAYEQIQNHHAAIECFTGILPDSKVGTDIGAKEDEI